MARTRTEVVTLEGCTVVCVNDVSGRTIGRALLHREADGWKVSSDDRRYAVEVTGRKLEAVRVAREAILLSGGPIDPSALMRAERHLATRLPRDPRSAMSPMMSLRGPVR